jgi:hypothetical protein
MIIVLSTKGGASMDKRQTIAEELTAGFTELADALESSGDIGKRFICYQRQLDTPPEAPTRERSNARGSDWAPVRRHLPDSTEWRPNQVVS